MDSVKTPKEVMEDIRAKGFAVDYYRIPVSHEQSPTDPYIDEYFKVLPRHPPTGPSFSVAAWESVAPHTAWSSVSSSDAPNSSSEPTSIRSIWRHQARHFPWIHSRFRYEESDDATPRLHSWTGPAKQTIRSIRHRMDPRPKYKAVKQILYKF